MTQIFRFNPSNTVAPSFNPMLDDTPYTVVVTWNVSAQRFYVNVYAIDGTLVCSVPLVESTSGVPLASLEYDPNQRVMIATQKARMWRPIGQIVQFYLQDCDPDSLNGLYDSTVLSMNQFSFPVDSDPGPIKQPGSNQRYMNMLGPWFTSSMIYRNGQFEVRP